MQQSRGAIGNLINRYKSVLRKCHLLNAFGSLAVAGMLVMGSAGIAGATEASVSPRALISYTGSEFLQNTDVINTSDGKTFDLVTQDNTITITATGQTSGGRGVLTNLYNAGSTDTELVSSTGLVITGSTFANNNHADSATNHGGGAVSLWHDGTEGVAALEHTINTTTFTENSADLGGAVAIFKQNKFDVAGTTSFTDVTFSGNTAAALGGAIYAEKENITISGTSKFEGNKSWNGGAISLAQKSVLNISGTTFSNNQAGNWGGAIHTDTDGTLVVENATFDSNIAGSVGGAIGAPAGGPSLTISGSTFTNNHAIYDGGYRGSR